MPSKLRNDTWKLFNSEDRLKMKEKRKGLIETPKKQQQNLNILVTKDIAARGLDFNGRIDEVIMFDLPRSISDFVHRAGRTGRLNTHSTLHQRKNEDNGRVTVLIGNGNYEKALADRLRRDLGINTAARDKKRVVENKEYGTQDNRKHTVIVEDHIIKFNSV